MTTTRADRAARFAKAVGTFSIVADRQVCIEAADLIAEYAAAEGALQARIDALMLEFCPQEMNAEQRAEWAKQQEPVAQPTVAGYSGQHFTGSIDSDGKFTPAPSAEPVAWLPDEGAYIIRFDDADREDELFAMAGAREAAMKRYAQISGSWNAHLFVKINSNSRDVSVPSAIPPAPAPESEAVRLFQSARDFVHLYTCEHEKWRTYCAHEQHPAGARALLHQIDAYLATLAQSQAQGEPEKL